LLHLVGFFFTIGYTRNFELSLANHWKD